MTVQTLSAHESRVKASVFSFTSSTTPKPEEIWQQWRCQAEQIQQRYSHPYCIDTWWWNSPHPATVCSLWGDRWLVRSTATPLWNLQKTKSVDKLFLLLLLSLWLLERSPTEHSRGYPVCNCTLTNAFHRVIGSRVAGFFMGFFKFVLPCHMSSWEDLSLLTVDEAEHSTGWEDCVWLCFVVAFLYFITLPHAQPHTVFRGFISWKGGCCYARHLPWLRQFPRNY